MINKTSKLSASLKTVIQCIGGFLEAFQKIADCAYGSNCGLKDLGSSMTRFCLRERGLESRLRTFNSQLTECLTAPLVDRLEEWKRSVAQLDRENGKEWRRAKSELQRATCELEKLSKRSRRKGSSVSSCTVGGINGSVDSSSHNEIYAFSTMQSIDSNNNTVLHSGDNMHLNFVQHDLILKQQTLAELERVSLRRAVVEERRRFAELLTCLKPVLVSCIILLKCYRTCLFLI
ncbi:Metastasis suppressor protein 1, variant 2 [Schistosoma haematobium]|uniref:Metastasis suppressor protein 1, variant 2 n=1 Tax=Schistosoma haematobium TaxID=6185 RepID=A0A922LE27_SCHHA|nr:Metastasis suppressor protein 1, variant 2 [Schistosoma haematobium]KAH9580408.1 Metastasis suppressor protein 1, variant 2 [Schistosoma haematobium]